MADVHFEDFCKCYAYDYDITRGEDFDVIVEIVSSITDGVTRHSVIIREHENENFVIREFLVEDGLVRTFGVAGVTYFTVDLKGSKLVKTNMRRNYAFYKIAFFPQSSQKKFLSEIRKLKKK